MEFLAEERFARLRFLALGWEAEAPLPLDLSAWREKLNLEGIELLYVLGMGDGSAYDLLRDWLSQQSARKLVFLEPDTKTLAHHLHTNHPLLSDPQVDVEWLAAGKGKREILSQLAERYPRETVEVIALPGAKARALRLDLLRKTTLTHSLRIDRLHADRIYHHFCRNLCRFDGGFYANAMRGAFADVPAIVCGAGPSLEAAIPLLQQLQTKALIIAGGSAIAALSSRGVIPHFSCAIDPNEEEFDRFCQSTAFESPLIASTRLHPSVFATCNGPFGYVRSGIGGAPELWMEEELGLTDPLLGANLSDESLSVTNICLAFAQMLGCPAILLAGLDLAYTGGNRYAKGIFAKQSKLSDVSSDRSAADRILVRKDKKGKRVSTAVRWVMEASAISYFAKKHPEIQWVNTTPGGLPIPGIPFEPLEEALEKYARKQSDLKGRIAREIALHPMPSSAGKLQELQDSLKRAIGHLEVLAGEKRGSKALAEVELQEELATSILFYDIKTLFANERDPDRWKFYLEHARAHHLAG